MIYIRRHIVIVSGDRNWDDERPVELVLRGLRNEYGADLGIVHGAAPGLDSVADRLCRRMGIRVKGFPADWTHHRQAAGPIRNREMLQWAQSRKDGKLELCVGFHNEIMGKTPRGNKRGTRDMLDIAAKADVPTYLVTGWPW